MVLESLIEAQKILNDVRFTVCNMDITVEPSSSFCETLDPTCKYYSIFGNKLGTCYEISFISCKFNKFGWSRWSSRNTNWSDLENASLPVLKILKV